MELAEKDSQETLRFIRRKEPHLNPEYQGIAN